MDGVLSDSNENTQDVDTLDLPNSGLLSRPQSVGVLNLDLDVDSLSLLGLSSSRSDSNVLMGDCQDARLCKRKSTTTDSSHCGSAKKLMKAELSDMLPSSSMDPGGCVRGCAVEDLDVGQADDDDEMDLYPFDTEEEQMGSVEDSELREHWIDEFKNMSLSNQQIVLRQLISVLPDPQIRGLRRMIEPLFQKDFISQLPGELALMIISCLSPSDLRAASSVSRQWSKICDDDRLWKKKCQAAGYTKLDEPSFRFLGGWETSRAFGSPGIEICDHMSHSIAAQNRRERENAYGICHDRSSWKALHLRKTRIMNNWRSRSIQSSAILKGHDEHVITCLQILGDRIVTGSDDNTLKVWSIERAQLLFTLTGHLGGVWTSQISDDGRYLVSGSTDRTVRVWCAETGRQLHILQGHTSTVRCMSLHKKTLVSGSRDQTLRVWNILTGECLRVLIGHNAAVRCVQFDGKRVVSGAYDFTVKVWNVEDGDCVHTLHGHTNRVYSLLFDPARDLVVSGSLDTTIRVWDIKRGLCLSTLVGHQSLTSGMQLRGHLLVSCNADSDVRVWDIRNGTCLHRLHGANGHASAITSLQLLENGLVATSSDDGTVKLWDIVKGEFVRDVVKLASGGSGGCIWRLKCTDTLLACAVGSRNGTEDTKLILIDFDASYP